MFVGDVASETFASSTLFVPFTLFIPAAPCESRMPSSREPLGLVGLLNSCLVLSGADLGGTISFSFLR